MFRIISFYFRLATWCFSAQSFGVERNSVQTRSSMIDVNSKGFIETSGVDASLDKINLSAVGKYNFNLT